MAHPKRNPNLLRVGLGVDHRIGLAKRVRADEIDLPSFVLRRRGEKGRDGRRHEDDENGHKRAEFEQAEDSIGVKHAW